MNDSANHLAKADAALALVKTQEGLDAWHDEFMSGDEYAGMEHADAAALERLYQAAVVRVCWPGALVG